ncbi:uncharacterized protein LOC125044861 [Penaeus chinensis]|uniref:uncharacterized protein LOC125044861 n=1 Tax=Penaeus chinensis TaxID=139456 RepID=UPI001FB6FD43|nr:uncharacterized protein LOC125044861 [Penaeus chinensis]
MNPDNYLPAATAAPAAAAPATPPATAAPAAAAAAAAAPTLARSSRLLAPLARRQHAERGPDAHQFGSITTASLGCKALEIFRPDTVEHILRRSLLHSESQNLSWWIFKKSMYTLQPQQQQDNNNFDQAIQHSSSVSKHHSGHQITTPLVTTAQMEVRNVLRHLSPSSLFS